MEVLSAQYPQSLLNLNNFILLKGPDDPVLCFELSEGDGLQTLLPPQSLIFLVAPQRLEYPRCGSHPDLRSEFLLCCLQLCFVICFNFQAREASPREQMSSISVSDIGQFPLVAAVLSVPGESSQAS